MSPTGPLGGAAATTRTLWLTVLDYCAVRRVLVAASTHRDMLCILAIFARVIGPDLPISRLRRHHVEKWLKARGDEVQPATIRAQLGTVRSFCQWVTDHRYVSRNPCAGIDAPRVPETIPRELKTEEVTKLLLSTPDIRGELVVLLCVEEGLRVGEVASRQIGDIDFGDRLLFVRGKGRKERWLPLCDTTWQAIEAYLRAYPATSGPLIRSYHHPHRGVSGPHLSRLVAQWMSEAGVKHQARDGKSAHALRHTMAGAMLDAGADARDVQEALGHESLGSTWRYTKRRQAAGKLRAVMGTRVYLEVDQAALPPAAAT